MKHLFTVIQAIFLILTFFTFNSCSDISPAGDGTLTCNSEKFTATLTSTGYGKNSTLLPDYSTGNFSDIFQDTISGWTFKTNSTDSTGSTTNSVTVTIKFPQKTTVSSIKTLFSTTSTTAPTISAKKTIDSTDTTLTATWSTEESSISVNDTVDSLSLTLTLNKYVSYVRTPSELSLIKIIPEF